MQPDELCRQLNEAWNNLEPSAEGGTAKVSPIRDVDGAFAVVLSGGTRHFGIALRCRSGAAIPSVQYRGSIRMETTELGALGMHHLITATSQRHARALAWLCWELLGLGSDPPSSWSWSTIDLHVSAWSDMLRHSRANSAIGLVGELLVMHHLVTEHGEKAWAWWEGPHGADHDVRCPPTGSNSACCLEIKTTTNKNAWRVTMHSLLQAVAPKETPLFLLCVRLEGVRNGGFNLKELLLDVPGAALSQAQRAELESGGLLEGERWRFKEAVRFRVDDAFPAIRPGSFLHGSLPERISRIEYTVELGGLPCEPLQLHVAQRWSTEA